ncbi:MAG: hypothetical protein MUC74_07400 [Ideonella sp.]|nr:hypothetical protein [Ideonella sp.]
MRYRVADLSVDGSLALLIDADEHVHVVRVPASLLERGAILSGRRAKLGAHVFVDERHHIPLYARFESVACSQDDALARMHPACITPKAATDVAPRPSTPRTGEDHEFA